MSLLALFTLCAALVNALPTSMFYTRRPEDVYVPSVLYPHTGTIWHVNQSTHVSWDVSDAPENITNNPGRIQLRKQNQILPVILADGFDVRSGEIQVQVPWVVPDDDYSIVFFGDSGDYSDLFTISD